MRPFSVPVNMKTYLDPQSNGKVSLGQSWPQIPGSSSDPFRVVRHIEQPWQTVNKSYLKWVSFLSARNASGKNIRQDTEERKGLGVI